MSTEWGESQIGDIVVETAIRLHRELGPGLLESVYEITLSRLLAKRGLAVQRQYPVPIYFDGERLEEGFRADILIEGKVILELKSVEQLTRLHHKQLLTYLKLSGLKLGYLLNFGEELMKSGISRVVNGQL
ncbi:MAG: GxxExxY protein [Verrucomicrobiota bacterium JB024]|nr:GxxExxY protein [Verrucomicrobiota bacterium JB024]